MTKTFAVLLIASAAAFPAGDPDGFHVWKAADIEAKGKQLGAKIGASHVASEALGTIGNRTFSVSHRDGSGLAEWHEKQADIVFIETGTVTMVYGGQVVDGKPSGPGEIRGTSINGGSEVALGPGDVLHIPAKTPHMMKLAPGQTVTYFVTKVVE